jgi:hypothetical protein
MSFTLYTNILTKIHKFESKKKKWGNWIDLELNPMATICTMSSEPYLNHNHTKRERHCYIFLESEAQRA